MTPSQSSCRISAVIITLNEERNIQRCLESVSFCNEIVVVDSGSSDNTVALAEACNARVTQQEWLGYGPQKQFAVEQAQYDWVLCIDADEVVSRELQQAIKNLDIDNQSNVAYIMARRNHFLGRPLKHGEGYPDLSLRLFNRKCARWSLDPVHETVVTTEQRARLAGDLLHFSEDNISHYLQKQNRYTSLQAEKLFHAGKKAHAWKCFTSPAMRFIKFYFFRLGFLDGLPGFIHISIGCLTAFLKYAKLAELHKNS